MSTKNQFDYQNYVNGGTRLKLTQANMRRIPIPIPPLAEQKQIAIQLDQLLSQVNTLKNRLDNIPNILKRFRQSVLAAAVSGKLTEEWRGMNNEIETPSIDEIKAAWLKENKKSRKRNKPLVFELLGNDLQTLPNRWKWSQIGYIFDVYVGSTPSRKNEIFWGGDVSWVSSSEVNFCHIKATKETITEEGLANTSTSVHPPGTVLLAMIGQGKTRGQPAILDIYACHNQNTAALRILDKYCVSEYLYFFLYERYEETRRVGSGNNQKAMNKKIVQSLPFPLPPKEEQTEIVRQVEKFFTFVDQIEKQISSAQTRVNNRTQSILAKAFRGELTAEWRKQNPDLISGENSAESLLEEIRKERESLKPTKKIRKKTTA